MKNYFYILFFVLFFALTACGRQTNQDINETARTHEPAVDLALGFYNLTISAPLMNEPRIREAGENLQAALREQGINLNIDIMYYTQGQEENHYNLVLSQLAVGTGPHIISWGMIAPPVYRFVKSEVLADIYEIIDQSHLNREDFFINALTPFEIGGQLPVLPTQFRFEYIGINSHIPQSIAQRFAALTYVTPSNLIELYNDLKINYPGWEHASFISGADAYSMFLPEIQGALDFTNSQINLSVTTPLLENLRTVFSGNNNFGTIHDSNSSSHLMATMVSEYVFALTFDPIQATFNFENPFFVNYIPRACENGNLIQMGFTGANISVANHANPSLAWAFVEEFMSLDALDENRWSVAAPILRRYFSQAVATGISNAIENNEPREFLQFKYFEIENAMPQLRAISEMPTAQPMGYLIPLTISNSFIEFIDGETTTEEVIFQLENKLTAWMETEEEVEEYVAIAEESRAYLPTRTLTFHGASDHAAVAEQAAEAMNADWRARDYPYNFELVIDTFPYDDWEGSDARRTRLMTELMAGFGPDIFLYEQGMDMNAFAHSGLLACFNALIENCPQTTRDNFYTNAMEPFERAGGLFILPANFSFQYVAINAQLPQSILDRFSSFEFITLQQMFSIYLELMSNYGNEFGHMDLGATNSLSHIGSVISSAMRHYVDFDYATSNLTDPEFVSFLDSLAEVASGDVHVFQRWGGVLDPDWQRENINSFVFFVNGASGCRGGGLGQSDSFFTPYEPLFYPNRLLVNEDGALLLDMPWGQATWSGIGVPIAGNPELAWEFIQHLIYAYTFPEGRAAGQWNTWFGSNYLGSPIRRDLFEAHNRRVFERLFTNFGDLFINASDFAERDKLINAAIARIAIYNEMPMAMLSSQIPSALLADNVEQFARGLITSRELAQRLQNAVSLWLIE